MPVSVKVGGSWRTVSTVYIKVGGVWKATSPFVKVGGVWKSAATSPITVDVNWGISSGVSTTRTSATRTLTVPAGNPGVIRFSLSGSSGDFYYQKNGGSFTLFVHNSTLPVANGDTLALRFVGTSPSTGEITVYDNSLGASVGDFIGDIL